MLTAFATYLGKFVFFIAVAAAGFTAGKKFKASKKAKNSATAIIKLTKAVFDFIIRNW